MKKFVSILMTLILVLAMCSTAFATKITINGADGRTFNAYKLLNLTTSLKCTHGEDATHTDDCYNYAYTVNSDYSTVLQNVTDKSTDDDIIEYLSGLTDTDSTPDSLRDVANDIYREIKEARIQGQSIASGSEIDQGYWLIADVTALDGKNEANSLVMVDTKTASDLTVNLKTSLPTIEKKVWDINDSTGETTDWQDSADYDIGDAVPFQLTATLPSNVASYDTYELVFHDTLSAGLTLNANSIKVMAGGMDVTSSFTKTTTSLTDGCTFEVSCDNVLAIENVTVTKDTVFTVTYTATLNNSAVIGAAGNPNEVYLEFSNNPYDDGTGNTEKDKVTVFTYKVIINKTDGTNPLQGASFTLYKHNGTEYVAVGNAQTGAGANGNEFTWTGLDDGNYMLEETIVPDGYNGMTAIEFTISADHDVTSNNPKLTKLEGGDLVTGDFSATCVIIQEIENNTGTVLPETGAKGTMMLIMASSLAVCVAVVFMVTRKKMSVYED